MRRMSIAVVLSLGLAWAADRAREQKFQQAVDLMETRGDLQAALKLFEELARGPDRNLAARSLLYLGSCYEKLGQEGSQRAYERIVREFADQRDVTAEARSRLAALGQNSKQGIMARQVWAGPEVQDITGTPSPDGRYLSFVDWTTGNVGLRDTVTGEDRLLTHASMKATGEFALFPLISPNAKQVVYSWFNAQGRFEIRMVGLDGSDPRILVSDKAISAPWPCDWTRDGKHILASFEMDPTGKSARIVLVSVADGSVRVLHPSRNAMGKISPDGRYVVYSHPAGADRANHDLYLLSAESGREVPLVESAATDLSPIWTPDGKRVLFVSNRSGTFDLWAMAVNEGQPQGPPEMLKPDVGQVQPMGFTRDGSYYYGLRIRLRDIYMAEIDPATATLQTPPRQLTDRYLNGGPAFAPDGDRLAYHSRRSHIGRGPGDSAGPLSIIVRSLKTGQEQELTLKSPLRSAFYAPRWSPDGSALLVNTGYARSVSRIEVQTGEDRLLVDKPSIPRPALSPDGKTLFYQTGGNDKEQGLVAHDLATGAERDLIRMPARSWLQAPTVSPDGERLAFIVARYGEPPILMTVASSGGEPRTLLRLEEPQEIQWLGGLAWSRDGRYLFFVASGGPSAAPTVDLWRILADGGQPHALGLGMKGVGTFDIHPDGRRLAFTGQQNRMEVWVLKNLLAEARASR